MNKQDPLFDELTHLEIEGSKFGDGNGDDGKHYWLTPPDLMARLQAEFGFDFDACPNPIPPGFDGLVDPWGQSTYVNPPFGSIIHDGKKKGPTAWARKAIAEAAQGKRVVMVYPIDKWVLMLLAAGAQVRNLGDVRWCAVEDGSQGKGTGRHIAAFILGAKNGLRDDIGPCERCGRYGHTLRRDAAPVCALPGITLPSLPGNSRG